MMIETLTKIWPILTGIVLIVFGSSAFVWRTYVRTQVNEKQIDTHKKDDQIVHTSIMAAIERLDKRFDDVVKQTHDTHIAVVAHVEKQEGKLNLLGTRLDQVGAEVAEIKTWYVGVGDGGHS